MLNICTLQGRFTAQPELKQTNSGISVLSFSIACERDIASQDGTRETDFINCVAWRNTADFIARYFNKGDSIIIDGRLTARNYEDKNGNKRTAFEIVVDHAHFCGSKSEQTKNAREAVFSAADVDLGADDEVPF